MYLFQLKMKISPQRDITVNSMVQIFSGFFTLIYLQRYLYYIFSVLIVAFLSVCIYAFLSHMCIYTDITFIINLYILIYELYVNHIYLHIYLETLLAEMGSCYE